VAANGLQRGGVGRLEGEVGDTELGRAVKSSAYWRVWKEGWDAKRGGTGADRNPYPARSLKAIAWHEGWTRGTQGAQE